MKRLLMLMVLAVPLAVLAGGGDPAEQNVSGEGWTDVLVHYLKVILGPAADWAAGQLPGLVHGLFAILAGAILSILIIEFGKKFDDLLPTIYSGPRWDLKIKLAAALVGGMLGTLLGPTSVRAIVLVFIGAAVLSPKLYDWAWAYAPKLAKRWLGKLRGDD